MFGKKKPVAKKLEVKHEGMGEVEVKINVRPLVTIEKHESRINGKVQAPEFRISIGGRDVLMVNSREYDELFMEMLRHKDAGELIHDISEVHAEEHAHGELEMVGAIKGLKEALEGGLGEALAKAMRE